MPTRSSISTESRRAAALLTLLWTRYASLIWAPTVKKGCSDESGSWKIIAILLPRSRRTCSSLAALSCSPSSQMEPVTLARVPRCRPRIAWLVNDSPSTAFTTPSSVEKCTRRSCTSRNAAGALSASKEMSCAAAVMVPSSLLVPRSAQLIDGRELGVLGVAHPRVDRGVEQVDDEVHHDHGCRRNQHADHDDRQVDVLDGVDDGLAHTVQIEHRFGDRRATDHRGEIEAGDRHDGTQRGPQSVLDDDPRPRQTLRPGGADVVLGHRLEHLRPGEANIERGIYGRECYPRPYHARHPLLRIAEWRHVGRLRQEAVFVGKDLQNDEPDEERRERVPDQRHAEQHLVRELSPAQGGDDAEQHAEEHPENERPQAD